MDLTSVDLSDGKGICHGLDNKINLALEKDLNELKPEESSNKQKMQRTKRNRREAQNVAVLLDKFVEPLAAVSGKNLNDTTFEPTIDMMVNDFDDEQTLDEEEVLASLESQDPESEIATLMEEGDMPLEELLSKYGTNNEDLKTKQINLDGNNSIGLIGSDINLLQHNICENSGVIVIESCDEESADDKEKCESVHSFSSLRELKDVSSTENQSHLIDLYPENFLSNTKLDGEEPNLERIYGGNVEDDDFEDDDDDFDTEYLRKSIMVGAEFQATIPTSLSQYGDVLPYENEDKLVWEPRQVSELEVEEYLIKVREIKPLLPEDVSVINEVTDEAIIKNTMKPPKEADIAESNDKNDSREKQLSLSHRDRKFKKKLTVVKDNEQALHLLVQCGYDFREALRRKRLNALPHSDTMSIWSEEECRNFEEGIHKFGKDFLKIRQNLVRTRTMRELVQFYYLWKKSERRDRNFANANTVDHMELYLNESNDFNVNTAVIESTENVTTVLPVFLARKTNSCSQFSIMTGGSGPTGTTNHVADSTEPGKTSTNIWLKCTGIGSNS